MKGLVLKDLLVLKSAMRIVVIIVVLFSFMGAMSGSAYMSTFASVYAAILPMTCMAYDERSKFNQYAMIMPVKPAYIALSKYITGLVLALAATVISLVTAAISKTDFAAAALSCILIPLVYHTFLIPLMLKFGTEKSRLVILIGVVVPAVIFGAVEGTGLLDNALAALGSVNTAVLAGGTAAVVLAMYIASIYISISICKNKEW